MKPILSPIVMLPLVILGALFLWSNYASYHYQEDHKDWITVSGRIDGSGFGGCSGGYKRGENFNVTLHYSYPVGDLTYERVDEGKYSSDRSRKTAQEVASQYPQGKVVLVRVNPLWPSQSFILREDRLRNSEQVKTGIFLYWVGVVLLVTGALGFLFIEKAVGLGIILFALVVLLAPRNAPLENRRALPVSEEECVNQAEELRTGPEWATALDYSRRAVELNPKNAKGNYLLAYCYYRAKNIKKTVECCSKAIALGYKTRELFYYQGLSYINLQDYEKAEEAFQNGLSVPPDSHIMPNLWGALEEVKSLKKGKALPPAR